MRFVICTIAVVAAATASGARAEAIVVPPASTGGLFIAQNYATSGSWSGVAQSFVARDALISLGFYFYQSSITPEVIVYSLYAGDGVSGPLLAQRSFSLGLTPGTFPPLIPVNFSAVSLTPGLMYTVSASTASGLLPPVDSRSNALAMYSGSPGAYADGRFYYIGGSFDNSSIEIAGRDLAFSVSAVPEPASTVLLAMGLLSLVALRARHRHA
jgi:PEP-CTERM motif